MPSIGKQYSEVTFVFDRKPDAKQVYLAGTFTEWDPTAVPMTRNKEGTFKVRCRSPSGRHEYKFFMDVQMGGRPRVPGQSQEPLWHVQ